jgi:hypothetical protein
LLGLEPGQTGTALAADYITFTEDGRVLFQADVNTDRDQVEVNNHLPATWVDVAGEPPAPPQPVAAHAIQHEAGGTDAINVAHLEGKLASKQDPTSHAQTHGVGGTDQMSVDGLSGTLATPQPTAPHANEKHTTIFETAVAGAQRVADHNAAEDAHSALERLANKGEPYGYVGADENGQIPGTRIATPEAPSVQWPNQYAVVGTFINSGVHAGHHHFIRPDLGRSTVATIPANGPAVTAVSYPIAWRFLDLCSSPTLRHQVMVGVAALNNATNPTLIVQHQVDIAGGVWVNLHLPWSILLPRTTQQVAFMIRSTMMVYLGNPSWSRCRLFAILGGVIPTGPGSVVAGSSTGTPPPVLSPQDIGYRTTVALTSSATGDQILDLETTDRWLSVLTPGEYPID